MQNINVSVESVPVGADSLIHDPITRTVSSKYEGTSEAPLRTSSVTTDVVSLPGHWTGSHRHSNQSRLPRLRVADERRAMCSVSLESVVWCAHLVTRILASAAGWLSD